ACGCWRAVGHRRRRPAGGISRSIRGGQPYAPERFGPVGGTGSIGYGLVGGTRPTGKGSSAGRAVAAWTAGRSSAGAGGSAGDAVARGRAIVSGAGALGGQAERPWPRGAATRTMVPWTCGSERRPEP